MALPIPLHDGGEVNKAFADRIGYLSQRPGWFASIGELDWLLENDSSDRSIIFGATKVKVDMVER